MCSRRVFADKHTNGTSGCIYYYLFKERKQHTKKRKTSQMNGVEFNVQTLRSPFLFFLPWWNMNAFLVPACNKFYYIYNFRWTFFVGDQVAVTIICTAENAQCSHWPPNCFRFGSSEKQYLLRSTICCLCALQIFSFLFKRHSRGDCGASQTWNNAIWAVSKRLKSFS